MNRERWNQLITSMFRVRRDRMLRYAFRACLMGEHGTPDQSQVSVLAFLREFCNADISTMRYAPDGKVDALASAEAEGRRSVWRVINFYLNLSDEELTQFDREFTQQKSELIKDTQRLDS